MDPSLLQLVFVASLLVVAAGLRWLARNPRPSRTRRPPPRARSPFPLPPLPPVAARSRWAAGSPAASAAELRETWGRLRAALDARGIQDRAAFEGALRSLAGLAATGDPQALLRVGQALRRAGHGDVVRRAAVAWFRLAAAQGSPEAHLELGLAHLTGEGVPENRREATRWLRRGEELGSAGAAGLLARLASGAGSRPR